MVFRFKKIQENFESNNVTKKLEYKYHQQNYLFEN